MMKCNPGTLAASLPICHVILLIEPLEGTAQPFCEIFRYWVFLSQFIRQGIDQCILGATLILPGNR